MGEEIRGAIRIALDNSIWTEARCCEARYLEFQTCLWCHQAIDSMHQRMFCCKKLEEVQGVRLEDNLKERGRKEDERNHLYVHLIPMGQDNLPCLRKHISGLGISHIHKGRLRGWVGEMS